MNISEQEYMAVVEDILNTLDKHKIDDQTRKDVLAIVYSLKDEIIHVSFPKIPSGLDSHRRAESSHH
jgi:hypothetical protein